MTRREVNFVYAAIWLSATGGIILGTVAQAKWPDEYSEFGLGVMLVVSVLLCSLGVIASIIVLNNERKDRA